MSMMWIKCQLLCLSAHATYLCNYFAYNIVNSKIEHIQFSFQYLFLLCVAMISIEYPHSLPTQALLLKIRQFPFFSSPFINWYLWCESSVSCYVYQSHPRLKSIIIGSIVTSTPKFNIINSPFNICFLWYESSTAIMIISVFSSVPEVIHTILQFPYIQLHV